jgi:predicted alpha/beta hydrolase family esterase
MKKAIIIHGMPSKEEYYDVNRPASSNCHWLPWIQKKLLLKNVLAQTPEMPEPYNPVYENWRKVFEQLSPDEETILIGHSCGGGFIVRWLSLKLTNEAALWQMRIQGALKQSSERLTTIEDRLRQFDPIHALRFGYAIVRKAGRIVRGTDGIVIGDRIDIQLGRGSIESEITGITEHI